MYITRERLAALALAAVFTTGILTACSSDDKAGSSTDTTISADAAPDATPESTEEATDEPTGEPNSNATNEGTANTDDEPAPEETSQSENDKGDVETPNTLQSAYNPCPLITVSDVKELLKVSLPKLQTGKNGSTKRHHRICVRTAKKIAENKLPSRYASTMTIGHDSSTTAENYVRDFKTAITNGAPQNFDGNFEIGGGYIVQQGASIDGVSFSFVAYAGDRGAAMFAKGKTTVVITVYGIPSVDVNEKAMNNLIRRAASRIAS